MNCDIVKMIVAVVFSPLSNAMTIPPADKDMVSHVIASSLEKRACAINPINELMQINSKAASMIIKLNLKY